ncbi:hypothetical protein [Pantoea agglomerans]|uniref:hypothetical protein n=1 Tax=Enterobacter agglomerans TaxID=549 RepID=UPI000DADC39E|nr:hypothetical protein [Pantoea agglomerans]RAH34154.1 hypothetical protein DOT37_07980 [Pantoea agglomerans]TGX94374.1 hypothetical protein E5821_07960 [Pantoea agglomerans]
MNEGIAAIIAASLGAIGAAIGLIITKENKTSEFRQDWINGLRKSLSDFIGYSTKINSDAIDENPPESQDLIVLNTLRADVILRLNNSKPSLNEIELVSAMSELSRLSVSGTANLEPALTRTSSASSAVLKAEWRRVKKGEWKYRICVSISSILAMLAIAIPSAYIYYHYAELINLLKNAAQ